MHCTFVAASCGEWNSLLAVSCRFWVGLVGPYNIVFDCVLSFTKVCFFQVDRRELGSGLAIGVVDPSEFEFGEGQGSILSAVICVIAAVCASLAASNVGYRTYLSSGVLGGFGSWALSSSGQIRCGDMDCWADYTQRFGTGDVWCTCVVLSQDNDLPPCPYPIAWHEPNYFNPCLWQATS